MTEGEQPLGELSTVPVMGRPELGEIAGDTVSARIVERGQRVYAKRDLVAVEQALVIEKVRRDEEEAGDGMLE